MLSNFIQIGPPTAKIWRYIDFQHGGPAAQYNFRFRICWYHCLQMVKIYQQTKFRRYVSTDGWDNYFRFGKTNVRRMGILLPVSISGRLHRNRCVILFEFRPNRTTHCGNMTSCRFSRWRPSLRQPCCICVGVIHTFIHHNMRKHWTKRTAKINTKT